MLSENQIDLGPEAHYLWSLDRRLASWANGRYTIDDVVVSNDRAVEILSAERVDLGPEAHWLWYQKPQTIRYFASGLFSIDGRTSRAATTQWCMAEQVQYQAHARLPDWYVQDLVPTLEEVELDDAERYVDLEMGTDPMGLEDLVMSYGFDPEERRGEAEEDRDVPIDNPIEDGLAELERAWRQVEIWLASTPLGKWAMVKGKIGIAISYYLIAHKVVYEDEAKFGEAIVTRFAPIEREAMVELRYRVREMQEKSEEDVTFVAAGFRLRFWLLK